MTTRSLPAATKITIGLALTLVSAIGYSFSLVLARVSYDHGTNALTIMVVRFALLVVMIFIWNRVRGKPVGMRPGQLLLCYLSGATYFVGIGAYLGSVGFIPVSLAVLVFYSYPLLTALLDCALHRRRPAAGQLLLLACAFGGLGLALGVRFDDIAPLGLILAVTAAAGVAVNMIVSSVALRGLPLTAFSLHMSIAALVCASIAAFAADALSLPGTAPAGWQALALSLLAFVVAYVALYAGLPMIGAVRLSMVMNLEPVATIVIALLMLGESMTGHQVLGGACVLGAVIAAQFMDRRQRAG